MRINRHTHLKSSTLLSIKNRRKKKGEKESTFKFKYTKKHCRRSLSFNQLSIHHINPKIGAETKFHKIIPLKFQKKKKIEKNQKEGAILRAENDPSPGPIGKSRSVDCREEKKESRRLCYGTLGLWAHWLSLCPLTPLEIKRWRGEVEVLAFACRHR